MCNDWDSETSVILSTSLNWLASIFSSASTETPKGQSGRKLFIFSDNKSLATKTVLRLQVSTWHETPQNKVFKRNCTSDFYISGRKEKFVCKDSILTRKEQSVDFYKRFRSTALITVKEQTSLWILNKINYLFLWRTVINSSVNTY